MHEFTLAQNMLNMAINVATENNASKISQINLKFGKFALVMEDQFKFCMDLLKEENDLTKDMEVIIQWEDGIIYCGDCQYEGAADMTKEEESGLISAFKCPKCNSYKTRIIKGMETLVENIKIS